MTRTTATALVAVATLAAPAAFAGENAASESRMKIERALGQVESPVATGGQVSASREGNTSPFGGLKIVRADRFADTSWAGNYGAGRVHPPAGR